MRITPGSSCRTYEDPHVGHRFMRVQLAPGALNLRYRARGLANPWLKKNPFMNAWLSASNTAAPLQCKS